MAENTTAVQADYLRIKYGFWIVVIGLTIVAAVFLVAITKWTAASDVTAVVGSVTGMVGTIIGAFFGVQVGSAGKEKAESDRKVAEDKALRLASAMQPEVAVRILGMQA